MTKSPTETTKNSSRKMGLSMFILAWLVLLGLLALFFDDWQGKQQNPNQQPLMQSSVNGAREVVLRSNQQHHYVVSGSINGSEVVFLLDTGATDVVIPEQLARKLQLNPGRKGYANTANGRVVVYATVLKTIDIGGIQLREVSASINPGMSGDVILLGMSALRQIEFTQRGDTLILRQ